MLVVTRSTGQAVVIGSVVVHVLGLSRDGEVRLLVEVPADVPVSLRAAP